MENVKLLDLIEQVRDAMKNLGMGKKTRVNYDGGGFAVIREKYSEIGLDTYSKNVNETIVHDYRQKYEAGVVGRSKYQCIRKVSEMMNEYQETGIIRCESLPKWTARAITGSFGRILTQYCEEHKNNKTLERITNISYRSVLLTFLLYLENIGLNDFSHITPNVVNECILALTDRYPRSASTMMSAMRSFFVFLQEKGLIEKNILSCLPTVIAHRRKIQNGFTTDEIQKILDAVDRRTNIGKRDYAILMIGAHLGLRAIDIANLSFKDIDWRSRSICIVQHKTGKPLSLPLEPEVGNAIADYLLNGREKNNLPYLFLCSTYPFRQMKHPFGSGLVRKYARLAGINGNEAQGRGFHSFRRSFGVRLLETETPTELLSQMFGHTHIDSSKPYIAINEQGLKNCALSLEGLVVKAGELI